MNLISIISLIIAVIAVIFPASISYFFGGELARIVSPPYTFSDIPDLTGKVAIVTGSNTGIGYVTAREMARKGAKVILAARDDKKGNDAVNSIKQEIGNVTGAALLEFLKLDLASFAEIRKFAKAFSYKRLPIDYLILNAGVMAPNFGLTADGLETQIGTNHFGHFLLVKLLTPIIKASKSRIVHVSSLGHQNTYPEGIRFSSFDNDIGYAPFTAYGQSKLANVLFSNELARQFNGTGVTSNSLHPGIIKTELARHIKESVKSNFYLEKLYESMNILFNVLQLDADGGALTQLYVATSPKIEGVTGNYYIPIAIKSGTSQHASNATLAKLLWQESERITKPFW